jgi:hypothetical protein
MLAVRTWRLSVYGTALRGLLRVRGFLIAAFIGPRFAKIAVEFFTEAAVLVAVFPILDTIIEARGTARITRPLVAWSEGLAAFFLVLAGIKALATGE